jgi:hypothetical protein
MIPGLGRDSGRSPRWRGYFVSSHQKVADRGIGAEVVSDIGCLHLNAYADPLWDELADVAGYPLWPTCFASKTLISCCLVQAGKESK